MSFHIGCTIWRKRSCMPAILGRFGQRFGIRRFPLRIHGALRYFVQNKINLIGLGKISTHGNSPSNRSKNPPAAQRFIVHPITPWLATSSVQIFISPLALINSVATRCLEDWTTHSIKSRVWKLLWGRHYDLAEQNEIRRNTYHAGNWLY